MALNSEEFPTSEVQEDYQILLRPFGKKMHLHSLTEKVEVLKKLMKMW